MEKIQNYLDDKGRLKTWPAKRENKILALEYIASKFQAGMEYTEKQVNEIIKEWHAFNDYFILRRGMVDHKFLVRTRDGARYWKEAEEKNLLTE